MSFYRTEPEPTWDEQTGMACEGCGDAAAESVRVQGRMSDVPLCRECLHDLTTICPQCAQRFWQGEGQRIEGNSLHCSRCAATHPVIVGELAAQLAADEARDEFNRTRHLGAPSKRKTGAMSFSEPLDAATLAVSLGEWVLPPNEDGIDDRWRDAFICTRLQDVLARRYYDTPFQQLSVEDRTAIRSRVEWFVAQMGAVLG